MYKPARRTGRTTRMLQGVVRKALHGVTVYVVAYNQDHASTMWNMVENLTNGQILKGTLPTLHIITKDALPIVPDHAEVAYDHYTHERLYADILDQVRYFDEE